jgi:hypothetical protein
VDGLILGGGEQPRLPLLAVLGQIEHETLGDGDARSLPYLGERITRSRTAARNTERTD